MTHAVKPPTEFEQLEERVSALARAIALKRATIGGVAGAALTLAVGEHWITLADSARVTGWITGGLAFASTVGAGAWIHRGTTPADVALEPVDASGDRLVTATVAAKMVQAVTDAQLLDVDDPNLIHEDTGFDPNQPPNS